MFGGFEEFFGGGGMGKLFNQICLSSPF